MSNPPNHPPSAGAPPVRQNAAGGPASSMNKEPSAEVLVDLLHAQRQISSLSQDLNELKTRLARRTHQMSVLQHVAEILAATPKVAQVAGVVLIGTPTEAPLERARPDVAGITTEWTA